jgi:outer membrane protein assembly factor BamB
MLTSLLALLFLQQAPLESAWTAEVNDLILGSPVVHGNVVIVASKKGRIAAFRIDSGKPSWKLEMEEEVISSLALLKDDLYVPAGPKSAVLDPASGKIKKDKGPEAVRAIPGASKIYLLTGFKFEASYKMGFSSWVICLDPLTGQPAWKKDYRPLGVAAVVESGGKTYLAGPHQVYVLDSKTGRELDKATRTTAGSTFHGVADKDRVIFIQGTAEPVVCFHPKTLKELWSWKGKTEYGAGLIPPLLLQDRLIFFPLPVVVTLDPKTGNEGWKQKLEGPPEYSQAPPALRGREMCVGVNGKLFGLDHETGKVEWTLEAGRPDPERHAPQPVWAGDRLLYACGRNLFCFKAK